MTTPNAPLNQGIQRVIVSKRIFDPIRNPPEVVDEALPTLTFKLRGTERRGVVRAPRGTLTGSMRITGSFRFASAGAPGTFGARITRLSVFSGSRESLWALRHSREGTLDVIYFPSAGQEFRAGDGEKPLYSVGPGTLLWNFLDAGSAYWHGAFMEGITS